MEGEWRIEGIVSYAGGGWNKIGDRKKLSELGEGVTW